MKTYPKHTVTCQFYGDVDIYDKISDTIVAEKKSLPAGNIVRFFRIKGDDVEHTDFVLNISNLSKGEINEALDNLGFYGLESEKKAISEYVKNSF